MYPYNHRQEHKIKNKTISFSVLRGLLKSALKSNQLKDIWKKYLTHVKGECKCVNQYHINTEQTVVKKMCIQNNYKDYIKHTLMIPLPPPPPKKQQTLS